MHRRSFLVAILGTLSSAAFAADADGWENLFNGKDLSNWVNVNCAPETWKVENGVIKCTGKPTGALRTPKMYENFVMEVEWRHMTSGGNAGIFIWSSPIAAKGVPFLRSVEVQVLDHGYGNTESHTTHGDVFPIHGSTMNPIGRSRGSRSFPSEERSKPSPEWNHYRIEARDGSLRLSVNGKEVSGGDKCNWRKGYIGLESEGAPTEWRMVRVKELPGANAPAAESAPEAQGHRPLYNGLDLREWKTTTPERWKPSDWQLQLTPGTPGTPLWNEAEFGDAEIIFDIKVNKKPAKVPTALLRKSGGDPIPLPLSMLVPSDDAAQDFKIGQWHRVMLTLKSGTVTMTIDDKQVSQQDFPALKGTRRSLGIEDNGADLTFANFYLRSL